MHVFVKMENMQQVLWMITYDEIIETDFPTILMKAKQSNANFYILLAFLWITIALLIAVSIYYHLIKYRPNTNNELKQVLHW